MCQYLILAYPVAVIAVSYAFLVGRGRLRTWIAYGLLVLQALLLWMVGGREMALVILVLLGFIGILGWYDFRRAARAK